MLFLNNFIIIFTFWRVEFREDNGSSKRHSTESYG